MIDSRSAASFAAASGSEPTRYAGVHGIFFDKVSPGGLRYASFNAGPEYLVLLRETPQQIGRVLLGATTCVLSKLSKERLCLGSQRHFHAV